MKTYNLAAQPRTDLGKKAAKTLRAEGPIPAVLNGGEIVTLPIPQLSSPVKSSWRSAAAKASSLPIS